MKCEDLAENDYCGIKYYSTDLNWQGKDDMMI